MTINVSEAICSDTGEIISVERKSQGSYVGGIYQQGSVTTFKTLASVQQPSPKELQYLPGGIRDKEVMMFISKKPLISTSDKDKTDGDVIIRKGKRYLVTMPADWNTYGYTRAFGVREE